MRRIRVLLFALCVMLVASWFNTANAYAAEGDGLVVTITSDASEYNANDTAIFTIEMTNEASTPATDVEYTVSLPHGMRAQDEASLKATVSEIGPGETVVKTVEAYVYEDTTIEGEQTADGDNNGDGAEGTTIEGEQTTDDNNNDNGDEVVSQVTDETNLSKTDEIIPQTGDWSMTVVVALAAAGLVAVTAGFITKRKKSGAGVLGIALCLLASGLAFSGVSSAYADEYVSRQTDASCRVSVNGSQDDATVSVSYTALEQTSNPGVGGEGGGSVIYEFSDDVLVVDDYQYIGGAYLFASDQDIAVGDKIAFDDPSDEETLAVGVVTQISQIGDQVLVEIDQATNLEDVFEYIAIDYGTSIDWSDVEFIDGVTVEDTPSTLASRSRYEIPKIKFSVNQELSGGGRITGSIAMSNWIDVKFDWSIWSGLKEAKLGFESSVDISFVGSTSSKGGGSITLNKTPITVPLSHGSYVLVNINLTYSLEGTVELTATFDASAGVQYKNGELGAYDDADAEVSFIAEAQAKVGIAPAATLSLMNNFEVIDAQIEIGPSATAKTTLRDTGLVCTDVDTYLYLELSSGKNTSWMETIGLTLSLDIWDEDSSPLAWNLHAEDGKLVEECTYKSSSSDSDSDDPVIPEASEFVYEIRQLDDGAEVVHITDYIGSETSIVIPVQIDGKDVVSVWFEPSSVEHISFEDGSVIEEFRFGYAGAYDTALAGVDFSNASNIRWIAINDYGTLTSLDLSGLSSLESASYYSYNGNLSSAFTGVVLKDNDALTELYVDAYTTNTTTAPDLSEAPHLTALELHWCGIESIDVSQNPELTYLVCTNNKITYLDTSALRSLAENNDEFVLKCSRNYIENIDDLEALAEELGLSSRWELTPQYS